MNFVLLRLAGYCLVTFSAYQQTNKWFWWDWVISVCILVWCIGDQWKKPDDDAFVMKLGIAGETILVLVWAIVLRDGIVLFALLSPLVRSCIHLRWVFCLAVMLIEMVIVAGAHLLWHTQWYWQLASILLVGSYTLVLGALLRHREQVKRLAALSMFELETRAKDDERLRIARQLHDRTGQYWSAIVRALDVALRVDGDQRVQFITKARLASLEGLEEMRTAVAGWSEGRHSPTDWLRFMEEAIGRYRGILRNGISLHVDTIEWTRFEDPTLAAETVARMVVEAMTNAVRNGQAEAIVVVLEAEAEWIEVTVQDDGKGFESEVKHREYAEMQGMGLASMRELAEASGGCFNIVSSRRRGTKVSITLPYYPNRTEELAK
ncbi:hypothetical protein A8709_18360 [Paenibacillus pectinilyticus]|uniref:Oxygen sensor histidine kinase NreB n=1 Tax=Paenibacillus pectinilyticus TaxID=512399 RepID=A0A1C0ZZJ0_9BACL|nr:ATP-binding protein [Paenibacillus pectinilyticus]OCT13557.1 hypothetical protein A8709_18360 [Paenibacillus pectinilyticus]